jgi:UDP-N-acetyl-D-glucosamine dehydrogenase
MNVVVMGQGYVGLPLAMAAAKAGHHVIGYEPDKARYEALASGTSYIEDVTDLQLQEALARGTYVPANSESALKDFSVAVITVPTPLKKGVPDTSYISTATLMLADKMTHKATVILESTVAPGTTRKLVVGMIERNTGWRAGEDFHVGFSPERIDPGNETWNFGNTPKIVSGFSTSCLVWVDKFYRSITKSVVVAKTLEEAELAKVFENTYRQVNIALVNELQRHAHSLGVDVRNVLDLAETKPFGFTKFTPGPGVGGHCLPVDPVYLTHHLRTEFGQAFRIVELAQEINDSQPAYVVRRLQDALNVQQTALKGASVLALGQSYKPGTADMRESPAVQVVELLRAKGARVTVVDPHFEETDLDTLREIPLDPEGGMNCGDFDAVVLLTPHKEFDLQRVADQANYVLDTWGVMPDAPHIERL